MQHVNRERHEPYQTTCVCRHIQSHAACVCGHIRDHASCVCRHIQDHAECVCGKLVGFCLKMKFRRYMDVCNGASRRTLACIHKRQVYVDLNMITPRFSWGMIAIVPTRVRMPTISTSVCIYSLEHHHIHPCMHT